MLLVPRFSKFRFIITLSKITQIGHDDTFSQIHKATKRFREEGLDNYGGIVNMNEG